MDKKITKATIKSFVKKGLEKKDLYIKTDLVQKILKTTKIV